MNQTMQLAATILSGGNREDVIVGASESEAERIVLELKSQ